MHAAALGNCNPRAAAAAAPHRLSPVLWGRVAAVEPVDVLIALMEPPLAQLLLLPCCCSCEQQQAEAAEAGQGASRAACTPPPPHADCK